MKQLGQGDDFDGYPDTVKIDTTDIGSLVKYLVQSKAVWLKNNFSDEEAEPGDIPLAYELKVYVLEETPKYITMEVKETSLYNGPRPRYTTYGITYLKPDGKKVESSDLNSDHIDDIKKELLDKVKTHISGLIEGEDFKAEDVLYKQDENSTLAEIDLPYNGIYVASVNPGSSAYYSGIKIGDIITKIDNIEINKLSKLREYIYTKEPGDTVLLTIQRNQKEMQVEVKLGRL